MKNKILSKITIQLVLKLLTVLFFFMAVYIARSNHTEVKNKKIKVYWFIPDGLRADRDQFNIYEWAKNGELPNLSKLMARGSYGYSRPVFPGHTPTNYATLLTGVYPDKHGVADGAMRTYGYPLRMVSKGGFSSLAKLVAPIWTELENENYLVSLQSLPGSTPPELFKGNVIKGRWGGWGIEFPSMVVEKAQPGSDPYKKIGNNRRAFTFGPELTTYVNSIGLNKYSFTTWRQTFVIELLKSNQLKITTADKSLSVILSEGEWSKWNTIPLEYDLKNDYQMNSPKKTDWENELSSVQLNVKTKIKLISLNEKGEFRLRLIFDSLNEYIVSPAELNEKMEQKLGPMVDFVDNYPPQLIYHPKDKKTFLEEMEMSWKWHQSAVPFLMNDLNSDFIIHSVYNPNQMLTSRWWLPFIDRDGSMNESTPAKEKENLWIEVKDMYREMDKVLGEVIKNADENTYIILSSDHGVVPLKNEVRLNNLFAKKGWLKFHYNPLTKNYEIDWKSTKVIFLQMNNIYINPNGLDGPYRPASSKEYYDLRKDVIREMNALKDENTGRRVLFGLWPREEVGKIKMPKERVGDLVISPVQGFSWVEDVSEDGNIITTSLKGGYKQALNPENIEGLLTPFVIVGPKIKANFKIDKILQHVDQYATIAQITKIKHPTKPILDGRVIEEIFTAE
jgi:predicted AlkP superfamily phosphohydrolase/phosphomutase